MKAVKRYAEPIAQAINMHGPVAGVLVVVEDLLKKSASAGKHVPALDDALELVGWLKVEVNRARGTR